MNLLRILLLTLLACVTLSGCGKKASPGGTSGPPTVKVARPVLEGVIDSLQLTGTVTAYQSVDLVARVEGYLTGIEFKDGDPVSKGQLLFTIQQDTYLERLKLNQAQLEYASAEYERQSALLKRNATSLDSVQQSLAKKQEAEAKTALAEIDLGYTRITSPFDGLIGRHLVDVGNVVGGNQANPTKLATVEQIEPIYIYFSINTGDALRIRQRLRAEGAPVKGFVGKARVFASLSDGDGFPYEGVLDFADNQVDASTGTLQLRAEFPNPDASLIPGFFAEVRIPVGNPIDALTVPNAVVLNDQVGDYLYIVDSSNVVQRRNVVAGPLKGDRRAITEGLSASDRVIVDGLVHARPGLTVRPQEAPPPTPTPTPTEAPSATPPPSPAPTARE